MSWSLDSNKKFSTTLYGETTNTDIYLNWFLPALNTCNRGTLKVLIDYAYTLCSADYHVKSVTRKKVFVEKNNYLQWLLKQIMHNVLDKQT